jgi:hypothetical protein
VAGGFRELYKDGPEEHYKRAGDVYRNPHERAVRRAVAAGLAQWRLVTGLQPAGARRPGPPSLRSPAREGEGARVREEAGGGGGEGGAGAGAGDADG